MIYSLLTSIIKLVNYKYKVNFRSPVPQDLNHILLSETQ